jgi:hypothetical protein
MAETDKSIFRPQALGVGHQAMDFNLIKRAHGVRHQAAGLIWVDSLSRFIRFIG